MPPLVLPYHAEQLSWREQSYASSPAQAPLLEREKSALPGMAAAAGCELIAPATGTKFSPQSMEKASTVSEPAEEGNVVECAMPGLRRSGTEGALVFPRVVVATG